MSRSLSTISVKSKDSVYFCDWYPHLFGVDEDSIPSAEEEDDEDEFLAPEEITADDLKDEDLKKRKPRYGRRAREKPKLIRGDGKELECICDIDLQFERHYVPHFGGGVLSEKENWRTPHFLALLEDYKEALDAGEEDASLMKLIEPQDNEKGAGEVVEAIQPKLELLFAGKRIKDVRAEILKKLRPLSCRELRRYRMPYSEAIILEMQEDGYSESASFLKSLLIEEYQRDQNREPCHTLRNSKTKIHKVVKMLTAVEKKGKKQELGNQSVLLLKLGKYFSDLESTWWWLANRLYEKAVNLTEGYVIDGGKSEAIARYVYGTFLIDYVGKVQTAQKHLGRARELSLGREWNAGKILNKVQEPIYKECCKYLCRALIETSRELRKDSKPEVALQFIHQSYKLCQESHTSRADIELETLFELGMTYQAVGELDWAITAFKKFMFKARAENQLRSVCDGHLELAICYRMAGMLNHCLYHLKAYLQIAETHNDENLIAFGNRYLGELFLNYGESVRAEKFFENAFKSFLKQCREATNKPFADWQPEDLTLPQDVELARALVGLAKGEILTKPICRLILRAGDVRNPNNTLKLMRWKNSQEICFDVDEEDGVDEEAIKKGESDESTTLGTQNRSGESTLTKASKPQGP